MKVGGNRPPEQQDISSKVQNVGKQDQANERGAVQKVDRTDRVDLSGKAKEMVEMQNTINQLPEVRTDKVNEIGKAVNNGTYKVDSGKIAQKMIDELV